MEELLSAFRDVDAVSFTHYELGIPVSIIKPNYNKENKGMLSGTIVRNYDFAGGTSYLVTIGDFEFLSLGRIGTSEDPNIAIPFIGRSFDENVDKIEFKFERNPTMGIKEAMLTYPNMGFCFERKEDYSETIEVRRGIVTVTQQSFYTKEEYIQSLLKKSGRK